MKLHQLIILICFALASCQSPTNKVEIWNPELLKSIIKKQDLNPSVAFESIISAYKKNQSNKIKTKENPIDIYVLYDTDIWKEYQQNETFEITFAHQNVNPIDSILYEHRITFIYPPKEFTSIEAFDTRLSNSSSLDMFKLKVLNSVGFKKAFNATPKKIEIVKEAI